MESNPKLADSGLPKYVRFLAGLMSTVLPSARTCSRNACAAIPLDSDWWCGRANSTGSIALQPSRPRNGLALPILETPKKIQFALGTWN